MSNRTPKDLATVTHRDFIDYKGASFDLHLDDETRVPMLLTTIDPPPPGEPPTVRPFAMLFKGPLDKPIPQRTYRLENPDFGIIELFLVPVGQESDGYVYESLFN